MLLCTKLVISILGLTTQFCTASREVCYAAVKSYTPPRQKCGLEGVLGDPRKPLSPSSVGGNYGATPLNHCFNLCAHTPSCVSFAIDNETGHCTLYDKRIATMEPKERKTGVQFYDKRCFLTRTATGLPNAGFEQSAKSFSPWDVFTGIAKLSNDSYKGTQSLEVYSPDRANPGVIHNEDWTLCKATEYRGSFAYKVLDLGDCYRPFISFDLSAFHTNGGNLKILNESDPKGWQVLPFLSNKPGGGTSRHIASHGYNFSGTILVGKINALGGYFGCKGLRILVDDFEIIPVSSQ